MIDHVSIPVRDLDSAARFYESILSPIGYAKLVVKKGTVGFGKKYADFWLNHRPDLSSHNTGDGFHVCLRTLSMEQVEAFYSTAVSLGARSSGEPGFREQYRSGYYAAFVTDEDDNKLEVVTFVNATDAAED